jgi:hypothetical protein
MNQEKGADRKGVINTAENLRVKLRKPEGKPPNQNAKPAVNIDDDKLILIILLILINLIKLKCIKIILQ